MDWLLVRAPARRALRFVCLCLLTACLLGQGSARAWQLNLPGDQIFDLAVDRNADAVAVGNTTRIPWWGNFLVVKLRGSGGEVVWRHVVDPENPVGDGAWRVVVDADRNVIAVGSLLNQLTIIKLQGSDGNELWRHTVSAHYIAGVKVDANGDVFLAGTTPTDIVSHDQLAVLKLRGIDGTEIWRHVYDPDQSHTSGLAVDTAGDVVAVGSLGDSTGGDFSVVKLRGADGTEIWRYGVVGSGLWAAGFASTVAVDASANVVVGGAVYGAPPQHETNVFFVKLRGSDGSEEWRYSLHFPGLSADAYVHQFALDAVGDVVGVGGSLDTEQSGFTAIKVRGTDGAELWRRNVASSGDPYAGGNARAVTVDGIGDVFVAARLSSIFAVVKLSGADGQEIWRDVTLPGEGYAIARDPRGDVLVGGMLLYGPGYTVSPNLAAAPRAASDRPTGSAETTLAQTGGAFAASYVPPKSVVLKRKGTSGADLGECGNGVLERGEECEDQNLVSGDGCSSTCQSEFISGGTRATSCTLEAFTGAVATRDRRGFPSSTLQCTDDDPTCDFGTPGDQACTFHVTLCLNVPEWRFSCPLRDVAHIDIRIPNEARPLTAVDTANRDALEGALTGVGGGVSSHCVNSGVKRDQLCTGNADCDTTPGTGRCQGRLVTFATPIASANQCTSFANITVPLRVTSRGGTTGRKMLALAATPSNDPLTNRRRPADTDALTLICKPKL